MKIGFVLDESFDGTDGVQQYMITLGNWLKSKKHEVYYLVGKTERRDIENIYRLSRNVRVRFNGNRPSTPLPVSGRKLTKVLKDLNLDVLHVQAPYSPLLAGGLIKRAPLNTAVVGTFHIMAFSRVARFGSNVLGKMNTNTAKRFDAMMAVSEPTGEFAAESFGFSSIVVPCPFLYETFADARRVKHAKHARQRIIFLGRLVPRKGPMRLLAAIEYLVRNQLTKEPFEVVIAGKGMQSNEMKKFIQKHSLGDVVTMVGYLDESMKPAFLADSDIAAFPSGNGETFGIALMEAMASSRGVVLGGNNSGYAAVVADKRQLVEHDNPKLFAESIAYWLEHASERKEMASKQQKHAATFDIESVGPIILRVYEEALQKRRQS